MRIPSVALRNRALIRFTRARGSAFRLGALCVLALGMLGSGIPSAHAQSDSGNGRSTDPPASTTQDTTGTTSGGATAGKSKSKKKKAAPAPAAAPTAKSATNKNIVARVVVVYPPETKGGASDQVADVITDVIQSRISASAAYRSVYFLPSLPTIRRALTDGGLSQADISKPTDSDTRVKKLTTMAGYDLAIVVSIDSYEFDAAKNQVNMVMSARLLDFAGGKPHGAGESASSPAGSPASVKEYDLAAKVARDLTEKLMTALLSPPKSAPAAEPAAATK